MENIDLTYTDRNGNVVNWHKDNFEDHKRKRYEVQLLFFQKILRKTIKNPDRIYQIPKSNKYVLYGIRKGIGVFIGQNMKVLIRYVKLRHKKWKGKVGYIKSAYFTPTISEEKFAKLIWPRKKH